MSCGKCLEPLSERLQSRKLLISALGMIIILLLVIAGGYFIINPSTIDGAIQGIAIIVGGYSIGQGISDKK